MAMWVGREEEIPAYRLAHNQEATPATLGRDGVLAVEKHLAQNRTLQKRVALAAQPVREGMAHLREAVAAWRAGAWEQRFTRLARRHWARRRLRSAGGHRLCRWENIQRHCR